MCQVTNRVIATSFPSSGVWSLYRNPIEKVAAFLDTKHRDRYIEPEKISGISVFFLLSIS